MPDGHLGVVLAALATSFVAVVSLGDSWLSGPVRVLLLGIALVGSLRIPGRQSGVRPWGVAFAAVCLTVSIVVAIIGRADLARVVSAAAVLVLSVVSAMWLGWIVLRRPVSDGHTIVGALAIYLLVVGFFSALHQFLAGILGPPYLDGVAGHGTPADYLYFSVITASTVGYGDLVPAVAAARAVAMSEALVGQLYLIAVLGAVVSNWGQPTRRRHSPRMVMSAQPEANIEGTDPRATTDWTARDGTAQDAASGSTEVNPREHGTAI
jgi:hypothetical protein